MLNTLSSILTLSNTLKVRVMKERVVEKSEEEEKPVEEEKPTEEEEKPEEEEEKPEEEKEEEVKPAEEEKPEEEKEEEVKEEKPAEEEKEEEVKEEEKEEEAIPLNPSHSVEIKLRGSVEDDVARLSSLLSHAVTQQFNVLTRLRKFMDNAGPLACAHA